MKLLIGRVEGHDVQGRLATSGVSGVSWAQFGDHVVVLPKDRDVPTIRERSRLAGVRLQEAVATVARERLHVVVQNGRLFQQEHPEVRVLHDSGRVLLVDIEPKRARRLRHQRPTCFGLFPLADNQVVFAARDTSADRMARVNWVDVLVKQVARAGVEGDVQHLAAIPSRRSTGEGFSVAANWAKSRLRDLGYTPRFQKISVSGRASRNVIAEKAGAGAGPRKIVIVTAHLDSINLAGGPNGRAPGADDNASGSAGLLEMARVFQDHRNRDDLRFVLFGGEEQGLFGSRHYVSKLPASQKSRIAAVLNMDMIGTMNVAAQTVMLEGASVSKGVMDSLATAAATYTKLRVETSLNPFASDHVPFIQAGLPAVLTIEGADSTNTNIHSEKDTLQHINYDLLLEVLRMNVALVAQQVERV